MPSFVEDAVAVSKKHALKTLEGLEKPELLLSLASHAYAIACMIQNKIGIPYVDVRQIPKLQTLGQGVQALVELPSNVKVGRLYALLVEVLKLIEWELARKPALRKDLDRLPSTKLKENGPCLLVKDVVHRFVGSNALKALRQDRLGLKRHVPPPILQGAPHPSLQLDGLRMHWNSDPLMPDVVLPSPAGAKPPLIASSGNDFRNGSFRLLLCPLPGPFNPQFQVLDSRREFRAKNGDSITKQDDLKDALGKIFAAAREEQLHLIVFPELMVCQEIRRHIVDLLNQEELEPYPYGVVAGSFHVWREAFNGRNAYVANECVLLDHLGQTLLRHDKRGNYGVEPKVARGPNKFFPDPVSIPPEVTKVHEAVQHMETIELLETSLGRIALAICADCIVQDTTSLQPALERARPDLLLIAAMTPETKRFETVMTQLAESGISSVFVNAHCACPPVKTAPLAPGPGESKKEPASEPPSLAAVHLALFEPKGAPPTRIRWQLGAPDPQVRYFKAEDDNDEWRVPENGGVSLLDIDGEKAGLIVDLGRHATWHPPLN